MDITLYLIPYIFNLCLSSQIIPDIWKRSCIIPVPRKPTVSCMNDLRPVVLTPIAVKLLERFVLSFLRSTISHLMDPLQFAY